MNSASDQVTLPAATSAYYRDKLPALRDVFGTDDISLEHAALLVAGKRYPIIDDVIVLLDRNQYPPSIRQQLNAHGSTSDDEKFAEDIQFTFGEEWKTFPEVLPEHEAEFNDYFDVVDLNALKDKRVCDLGCGIGRWGYFLKDRCRELVMVDFSDAIFVARRNLKSCNNALFFMCDIKKLPFRADFCDFLYCLGVLHHLPTNALDEVRALKPLAKEILIYLYYALDNRGLHFRFLLAGATIIRRTICRIRSHSVRQFLTWSIALLFYMPLIILGRILNPIGLGRFVPLYEFYHDKTFKRIRQDVYDRFFTRIEQRVSQRDIMTLQDTFSDIRISNRLPYWHFLARR
jgi:SAM-dependent methyltransferase